MSWVLSSDLIVAGVHDSANDVSRHHEIERVRDVAELDVGVDEHDGVRRDLGEPGGEIDRRVVLPCPPFGAATAITSLRHSLEAGSTTPARSLVALTSASASAIGGFAAVSSRPGRRAEIDERPGRPVRVLATAVRLRRHLPPAPAGSDQPFVEPRRAAPRCPSVASGLRTAWISTASTQSSRSARCSRTTTRAMPGCSSVSVAVRVLVSSRVSSGPRRAIARCRPRRDRPPRSAPNVRYSPGIVLQARAEQSAESCLVLRASTDQEVAGHCQALLPSTGAVPPLSVASFSRVSHIWA